MKKILCTLGIIGLLGLVAPAKAITVVEKPMGYITVLTSASESVAPNLANLTFTVETTDVNSQRASERNAQFTKKVINGLKEDLKTDSKSEIKTKNYDLRPNYVKTDKEDEQKILNYTVTNTISVKTSNVDNVGQLITNAINNNVTKVGNVTYSVEETGSDVALNEALTKARKMAEFTANKMGKKIVGIKSIHVNSYQQNSNRAVYASLKSDTTTPIEKGTIQQNVSVNAEFYVK